MKTSIEDGHRFLLTQAMLLWTALLAATFLFALNVEPVKAETAGGKEEGKAGFEELKGHWRRPDGGYVIEIRNVDASGKMDTGYFNPRPINVSKAEATRQESTTKIFIELLDAGYPGSTYTLTYDPNTDQLKGNYFQAAIQQSFEVVFFRAR